MTPFLQKISLKQASVFAIYLAATLVHLYLFAADANADCSACATELSGVNQEKAAYTTYQDLLERNKQFLEGPGGQDASKAIKVKSNILVLMLKIDTAKNNTEALTKDIQKKCPACSI